MRGGAAVARRAHNPKVAGSIPAPATIYYWFSFYQEKEPLQARKYEKRGPIGFLEIDTTRELLVLSTGTRVSLLVEIYIKART